MKMKLLTLMLMAGGTIFAAPHIAIGIGIGTPGYYAPAPVVVRPPCPGPGFSWVDGYWGPSHVWVNGYWAGPRVAPYAVAPYRRAPLHRDWDHDRDRDRDHDRAFARGYADGHRR